MYDLLQKTHPSLQKKVDWEHSYRIRMQQGSH